MERKWGRKKGRRGRAAEQIDGVVGEGEGEREIERKEERKRGREGERVTVECVGGRTVKNGFSHDCNQKEVR